MKRIVLIILTLLMLSGCRDKSPSSPDTHKEYQRIVSLAPNLTEIVFALEAGDKLVAVSSNCDYPAEVNAIDSIGSFWSPDIEKILTKNPDLVLTLWFEKHDNIAKSLGRLGHETLVCRIETIEDLHNAILKIAKRLDIEQKGVELSKSIKTQLDAIKARSNDSPKPKVLCVVQQYPLLVCSTETFLNEIINIAGGQNVMSPTLQMYPQISAEQLMSLDPDIIIQTAVSNADIPAQQKAAQIFWSKKDYLPAVKNGKVFVVSPDLIQRLGPRIPQGIEMIAKIIHPELYEQEPTK